MLKYYIPTTEVRINSISPFNIDLYAHKICESHPGTDVIKINWDNAEEEIQKHVKELRDKFDATSSVFYKKY